MGSSSERQRAARDATSKKTATAMRATIGEVRLAEDVDGGGDIDRPQQHVRGDDADRDPKDAADGDAPAHLRAVSFLEGRSRRTWSRYRATTRSVDSP